MQKNKEVNQAGLDNETTKPAVAVVYIIPKDAEPWHEAKRRALEVLEDIQWFFADEMNRLGYGLKTFDLVSNNNASLFFNQIDSDLTKKEFTKGYWNNCKLVAQQHGLRESRNASITMYVYEAYSIINGTVSHAGSRGCKQGDGGEVFISSLHLKLAMREWMDNETKYVGDIFDWIDSEPMKKGALSWHGRGPKLGDVSGSAFGVIAHELGHAFGLRHNKNDRNRRGNLMGYGCRGMRGYFQPNLTDDFCFLSKQDAQVINNSRLFDVRKLKPKSIAFKR